MNSLSRLGVGVWFSCSLALALTPAMVHAQSFAYVANAGDNTISAYRSMPQRERSHPSPAHPFLAAAVLFPWRSIPRDALHT